jgi:hypothetical protein
MSEFITEQNLMRVLLKDFDSSDGAPDVRDAVRIFEKVRSISEDKKTGLTTLSVRWSDPKTAADWANLMVQRLNSRLRSQALAESQRNVDFLQKEIAATSVVSLQQSMGRVLEGEMQKLMLARGNEQFAFKVIDPAIPPIEGKIDFVRLTKDGLVLRDYKTARSRWNPDKVEESAPQLRLYATLLDRELDGWRRITAMEFAVVTKAVKPVVTTHAVAMRQESVQACIDQIGQVWDGIRKGVFPTRPGWPCKTCPYASRCPAAINATGATDEP